MEVDEPIEITRRNYKDFVYDIERRINEDNMNENEQQNEIKNKHNTASKKTSEKQLSHIKKMNEMRKIKKEAKKLISQNPTNENSSYYENEIEIESKESFLWNFLQNQGLFLTGILTVSAGVYYITKMKTTTTSTTQKKEMNFSNLSLDF